MLGYAVRTSWKFLCSSSSSVRPAAVIDDNDPDQLDSDEQAALAKKQRYQKNKIQRELEYENHGGTTSKNSGLRPRNDSIGETRQIRERNSLAIKGVEEDVSYDYYKLIDIE